MKLIISSKYLVIGLATSLTTLIILILMVFHPFVIIIAIQVFIVLAILTSTILIKRIDSKLRIFYNEKENNILCKN